MKSKLDPWTKHMQEISKVQSCDECAVSKEHGSEVRCPIYPGMTNNIACSTDFRGNNKYFERMKVN